MRTTDVMVLAGCRPAPLAAYLKALGVLRLVAEQRDPEARGRWRNETFELSAALDAEELISFFIEDYRPTPVVAPWNGGSGFYPKDSTDAIVAISDSTAARLRDYRKVIAACRAYVTRAALIERPTEEAKAAMLAALRGTLPDVALPWLDAAVQLTASGPKYPPLLGTGGNDGRLDFTNNFMQHLQAMLGIPAGRPPANSAQLLSAALFGATARGRLNKAVGQFDPGNAGGANASVGFEGAASINPWDFILMVEGALFFAGSTSRRLGFAEHGELSYPFNVRPSAAGHGSSGPADARTGRTEQWVPLWERFATCHEIAHMFGEGRARVNGRTATRGSEFARALASLGTDRGLTSFQRYSFQERNGRAYLAVPMGRWPVSYNPHVDLLGEIDHWSNALQRVAADGKAPAKFTQESNNLERAIMQVCRAGQRLTPVLVALGHAEQAMLTSPRTACDRRLRPLPPLSAAWLEAADDGSPEFRLAAALASITACAEVGPLRSHLTPHDPARPYSALTTAMLDDKQIVPQRGGLVGWLAAVLQRRLLLARRHQILPLPLAGRRPAALADVLSFVNGDVDERKIAELLPGLAAIAYPQTVIESGATADTHVAPSTAHALFRLSHSTLRPDGERVTSTAPGVPYESAILAAAFAGRGAEACRRAARRLGASGWRTLTDRTEESDEKIRRAAVAVLFPLTARDLRQLARYILFPKAAPAAANR